MGDRPFLDYLLARCRVHGLSRVLLLAGHFSEAVHTYAVGARERFRDLDVSIVTETEPMGTAGAVVNARDHLDEIFYVLNGDSVFDFNWRLLGGHLAKSDLAAIALRRLDHTGRFGTVDLRRDRVVAFREKMFSDESGLVNAGVYLMHRAAIADLPRAPCSLETEIFPVLAKRGTLVGVEDEGNFLDIGVPTDFQEASMRLPDWTVDYLRRMSQVETGNRDG